jgi:DNA polymerase phi
LAAKDEFPKAGFPAKVWKHDDPLDSRERNQLAKVMKDSSAPDPEDRENGNNAKSSGVWNSKLHFAWEAVLGRVSDVPKNEMSKSSSKDSGSRLSFADFWADLVDSKYICMMR